MFLDTIFMTLTVQETASNAVSTIDRAFVSLLPLINNNIDVPNELTWNIDELDLINKSVIRTLWIERNQDFFVFNNQMTFIAPNLNSTISESLALKSILSRLTNS